MANYDIIEEDIDAFLAGYNEREKNSSRKLEFDSGRREIIKPWKDVQACPGSGKTTLIAAKLIILAKKWRSSHQGICVLTHTNVACDEIKSRLTNHPSGFKLTSYPHFIGTIQEFVDRFIALPYAKSKGWNIKPLDSESFTIEFLKLNWPQLVCRRTAEHRKMGVHVFSKNLIKPENFILTFDKGDNKIKLNQNFTEEFRSKLESDSVDIIKKKRALLEKGVSSYREMYSIAECVLHKCTNLIPAIQKRFPIIFIDEMQDTQKFQDDLINSIFKDSDCKIQRVGDVDQSIFDNMGDGEPNQTFNSPSEDLIQLKSTHRFGKRIATKITGLSLSEIGNLDADGEKSKYNHTVFIYDDNTKGSVLDAFAELIDPEWGRIKAIGATEGKGKYISSYGVEFDRRSSTKSYKPKKLIHTVQRTWEKHSSKPYSLIIDNILHFLRLCGKLDERGKKFKYFSKTSLINWLKEEDKFKDFQHLLTTWILETKIDKNVWQAQILELQSILEITELIDEALKFLEYDNRVSDSIQSQAETKNIYEAGNGKKIELSTIHGVKGETHDATLILETKYYAPDLKVMLPYLLGELPTTGSTNEGLPDKPTSVHSTATKQFMRQLYVGMSRPKHLLCLALHKKNIDDSQSQILEKDYGWKIKVLP